MIKIHGSAISGVCYMDWDSIRSRYSLYIYNKIQLEGILLGVGDILDIEHGAGSTAAVYEWLHHIIRLYLGDFKSADTLSDTLLLVLYDGPYRTIKSITSSEIIGSRGLLSTEILRRRLLSLLAE